MLLSHTLSPTSLHCHCSSSTVVVASAGMQADRQYLHKMLHAQHVMYQFSHRRPMSTGAVAQHLSNTLYSRRFFPLYTFNLCCGLDEQGRGAVYTYDAVGSHELVGFSCQGTGRELMQPVLDSQLKAASPLLLPPQVLFVGGKGGRLGWGCTAKMRRKKR